MKNHLETLKIKTKKNIEFIDITSQIQSFILDSKIRVGQVMIYTKHTTSGIRINENEKRLTRDLEYFLEKIAPKNKHYLHDDIELRPDCNPNERINGHSHLKSLFLNTTESAPVIDGQLSLGKWQSIFFVELDGPREREVIIHCLGE